MRLQPDPGTHQGLCSRASPETNNAFRGWHHLGLDPEGRGKSEFQEPIAEAIRLITKEELDFSVSNVPQLLCLVQDPRA